MKCLPRWILLLRMSGPQVQRMCMAVSSVVWQNLHIASTAMFILNICLFSLQWPVNTLVTAHVLYLVSFNSSLDTLLLYPWMSAFECFCPGTDFHDSLASCLQRWDSSVVARCFVIPQNGSGPIWRMSAPFLASSSAASFPAMLECPGTYVSITLLELPRAFRFLLHVCTSFELYSKDCRSNSAAWLSELMYMC